MARRMTQGQTAVDEDISKVGQHSVPQDTGEAYDLEPANLTLTIGFGPSLFDERFGFASARPAELEDLPKFAGDQLIGKLCGGDIAIQACSDNPQVAVHAIRNLARWPRRRGIQMVAAWLRACVSHNTRPTNAAQPLRV